MATHAVPATTTRRAWWGWLAFALSVLGLGVSAYLTIDHFARVRLICSDSGVINCQKVTTSAQSHFLGIPVAVLGLAFYLVLVAINWPPLWRSADSRIHWLRLMLLCGGMLFVLYLVSVELFVIGNICLWCTSVHMLTFLLFALTLITAPTMLRQSAPTNG